MVRLPPPPRFNLPPPPMLSSSDIFDTKLIFQLTCSSIRQQEPFQQIPKSRLIAISCISFLIIILLFVLIFLLIQFYRQRKSSSSSSKKPSVEPNTHIPINPSRSYETISSIYTGVYVDSIDTSATTYSTNPSHTICLHCNHERDVSITSPPPYYHTLDILPS